MNSLRLLPAAILAAAFAVQAAAQPADLAPITRDQALQRADALFAQLDLNHDGIVTREEAIQATSQLKAEARATGRDVAPGIGNHTARFLAHRFAGVQSIDRQQFEQAMLAHFDRMDLNRDGVLSTEEREQAKAGKRSVNSALGGDQHPQ
jgi:hypothetical protein